MLIDIEGDLFLASSKDWRFAALGGRRTEKGIVHQRFRKEIIRVGDFVKASDDIKFSVTPATLLHWVDTFQAMKANGVTVRIPNTHEGVDDPDQTRGIVEDIFIDGNSLIMSCDLIGDDAIAAAARNDVSICVPTELIDGLGKKHVRPIQHVALTPNPVIPGLAAFERIAASESRTKMKGFDMKLTDIEKAIGLDAGTLTESNAVETIKAHVDKTGTLALSNVAKALGSDGFDGLDKIELAVKTVVDKKVENAVKLIKEPKAKDVDPMIIKLSRKNCENTLDNLVAAARITPAVKDQLHELFLSDTPLTLSLATTHSTDQFDAFCEILKGNNPVPLEDATGPQTLKLADLHDPEKNPMAKAVDKLIAAAKTG